MRARNIKPGFFSNEQLPDCEPLARLLFIGLWCMADKKGRLQDRPRKMKIEILPCDDCDMEVLLAQLQHYGFILRYEISGHRFIQVLNFSKHQRPHRKEQESTIPGPTLGDTIYQLGEGEPPPIPPDPLIPDILIPESSSSDDDARAREPSAASRSKKLPHLSRLPFDALPPEWGEWAHADRGWDAETTADVWLGFRDYWQAKQGKSASKSCWAAAWRNWCRQQNIKSKGKTYATHLRNPATPDPASRSQRFRRLIAASTYEDLRPDIHRGGEEGRPGVDPDHLLPSGPVL